MKSEDDKQGTLPGGFRVSIGNIYLIVGGHLVRG